MVALLYISMTPEIAVNWSKHTIISDIKGTFQTNYYIGIQLIFVMFSSNKNMVHILLLQNGDHSLKYNLATFSAPPSLPPVVYPGIPVGPDMHCTPHVCMPYSVNALSGI